MIVYSSMDNRYIILFDTMPLLAAGKITVGTQPLRNSACHPMPSLFTRISEPTSKRTSLNWAMPWTHFNSPIHISQVLWKPSKSQKTKQCFPFS